MNLHEVWSYDDEKHVQKLEEFVLLCRMCHHVKHLGFAGILADQGKLDYNEVTRHFSEVNSCSNRDFETARERAFEIWRKRSKQEWTQDFGEYKEYVKK